MADLTDPRSDEMLLAGIRAGSRDDFTELVKRHSARFFRVAFRVVHNHTEAEDIVQDSFIKIWQAPEIWQADQNARFTTWFYKIVLNHAINIRKKRKVSVETDMDMMRDPVPPVDERMMAAYRQQWMRDQIRCLPTRQQIALSLCFFEGHSNQEAADMMGLGLKALQSLLMRAKATLRESATQLEWEDQKKETGK